MPSMKRVIDIEEALLTCVRHRAFSDFCKKSTGFAALLVSDNPFISHYFKQLFRGCECNLTVSESAEEAMREIDEKSPEIVLVDDALPDIAARSFMKAVREIWPALPMVVMMPGAEGFISQDEATVTIGKPFSLEDAIDAIKDAVAIGKSLPHRRAMKTFKPKFNDYPAATAL